MRKLCFLLVTIVLTCLLITSQFAVRVEGVAPSDFQIAFASDADQSHYIYIMNQDGSNISSIPKSDDYSSSPACSSDGKHFAFASNLPDGPYTIDASGFHSLNAGDLDFSGGLSLSQDGSKIAFVSARDSSYQIYVINSDGSGLLKLTDDLAGSTLPSLSPDGTKLAFQSQRTGNDELYVVNTDGSNLTRLTFNPGFDGYPAWSPDGTHIAFTSDRDGHWQIYTMNVDGSNVVRITNDNVSDYQPNWSSDGSQIAFVGNQNGGNQIYAMNANGSNIHQLTHISGTKFNYAPCWLQRGTIFIAPTVDDLRAKVTTCVTNDGIANSLNKKIDHEDWQPFINEVEAQSGKKIDTQCAQQMIDIATYLMSHPTPTATPMTTP